MELIILLNILICNWELVNFSVSYVVFIIDNNLILVCLNFWFLIFINLEVFVLEVEKGKEWLVCLFFFNFWEGIFWMGYVLVGIFIFKGLDLEIFFWVGEFMIRWYLID